MEKYEITKIVKEIFDEYSNEAITRGLHFKAKVYADMPEVVSFDWSNVKEILKHLVEEAFLHTVQGKLAVLVSISEDEETSIRPGEKIWIKFEVLDTGESYNIESDNVKVARKKIFAMGSALNIDSVPRLGARVGFDVMATVISEDLIEDFALVTLLNENVEKSREIYIEGINVSDGLSYVDYDEEIYLEILREYYKGGEDSITKLKQFSNDEDWENYRIKAHAVKSGAYTIGATDLADLAKELESAAKTEQFAVITNKNGELVELLAEKLRYIGEYFNENDIDI